MELQKATDLVEGKEVDPKLQKEMDHYVTALMYVMHNPKTADSVVEMLKSAPPEESIPYTALHLNKQVEQSYAKKNKGPVKDEVKLAGAMYLASDLSELGTVAKVWDRPVNKEEYPNMFSSIVSKYIHNGLADGSIDPIKLQADTEPLLNEKQREIGGTIQRELGLPDKPTASMGMDMYAQKKTAPLQKENQELKARLSEQQQLQQQQQQQQGGGNKYGF